MPLSILVPLIVVGIIVVILCVRTFGGVKSHEPLTQVLVKARFLEDFPNANIAAVHIDDPSQSAWLALTDENSIGILQPFGSGTLVRTISQAQIKSVDWRDNSAVLHINDFAMKTVIVNSNISDLREALKGKTE